MSKRIVSALLLLAAGVGFVGTATAEPQVPSDLRGPLLGEVAGEPVYYRDVVDPLTAQLKRLDGQAAERRVKRSVESVIGSQIQAEVQDRLLLAEAWNSLTEKQRDGVESWVASRHAEDPELAADLRVQVIIHHFLRQQVDKKIEITPEAVGRYYRDNLRNFVRPVGRDLRVIRALSDDAAEIGWRLAEGEAFEKLAESELNQLQAPLGGVMMDVFGEGAFSEPSINAALERMGDRVGMVSPALHTSDHVWWVRLDGYRAEEVLLSLDEARPDIERTLHQREARELQIALANRLREHEDYAKVDAMAEAAVNHYWELREGADHR